MDNPTIDSSRPIKEESVRISREAAMQTETPIEEQPQKRIVTPIKCDYIQSSEHSGSIIETGFVNARMAPGYTD